MNPLDLLSRWLAPSRGAAGEPARWAVVDVETTGLDVDHDHLLAIAAIAVQFDAEGRPCIALADSFEAVVHHESPSTDKDNILLHGIGVGAQRAGVPPVQALDAFERWLDGAPLLGYHASFDEAMIERASRAARGRGLPARWLDLAPVAAALHPGVPGHALDDWLDHFGIDCAVRHQAAADTLATAELLLRLWPAVRAQRCASFGKLQTLARQQRWLGAGS